MYYPSAQFKGTSVNETQSGLQSDFQSTTHRFHIQIAPLAKGSVGGKQRVRYHLHHRGLLNKETVIMSQSFSNSPECQDGIQCERDVKVEDKDYKNISINLAVSIHCFP